MRKRVGPPPGTLASQLAEAARIVLRVREGESLAEGALRGVDEVDRAAVQDLVYSYLRAYGRADAILGKLLKTPLKSLWLHCLMGLAIQRLSARPEAAHVVVSQAVEAAAQVDQGRMKGLVNAVLRNYQRQAAEIEAAIVNSEEVRWQHPFWWIRKVKADHPAHWQDILAAGNLHPPMALRVNRRKIQRDAWLKQARDGGLGASAQGEDGVLLTQPVGVQQLPGFSAGQVSVQDLGAQTAAALLAPTNGQRVLDACAAPGGKTAHLLERYEVSMLALDVSPERCKRIHENLERLGLSASVKATDCRDREFWWDGEPFDAVLADVPCSASGVVRRHPDSKWLRQSADPVRFAEIQSSMLDVLSSVVRPGGKLLYATCSVFREENQDQVAAFLARHHDFSLIQEIQPLPCPEHDGFYYALLVKAV